MLLLIVLFYQLMLQYESEPIICVYYQRLLEPHIQLLIHYWLTLMLLNLCLSDLLEYHLFFNSVSRVSYFLRRSCCNLILDSRSSFSSSLSVSSKAASNFLIRLSIYSRCLSIFSGKK